MAYEVHFQDLVHFTDRQKLADEAVDKYKYILYGGAVGGGKSYWIRWELVKLLMKFAKRGLKGVRVGLFCEDYPALKDRHLSKIQYEFPKWLGELNKSDYEFTLSPEYGSGVICFRNLDDPSKYQSSEFAVIAVDELTKNTRQVFDFLRTRLRWANLEDTKFIAGTNPGGIGHDWVKKTWIDKVFESGEQEQSLFYFIPAKASDNPNLPSSYYLALEGLPEKMKRAYVEGNWDVFEGQYFTEWNRDKHVVEPFTMPQNYKRFRAYDHGRENPACMKWYALDYDGNVYVYRELYQRGFNVDQLSVQINKLSEGEEYSYSVADPSIFAKTGFVDAHGGQTIAESFVRHGIQFYPASNRRVDGWNLLHQYLNNGKIKYFSTCKDSIRTIPNLIHDDHKPEDLDSGGEDHAADTDRYFLMSLHERKSEAPLNEVQKKIQVIKNRRSGVVTPSVLNKFYQSGL
jgi:phage terminase large subunit